MQVFKSFHEALRALGLPEMPNQLIGHIILIKDAENNFSASTIRTIDYDESVGVSLKISCDTFAGKGRVVRLILKSDTEACLSMILRNNISNENFLHETGKRGPLPVEYVII